MDGLRAEQEPDRRRPPRAPDAPRRRASASRRSSRTIDFARVMDRVRRAIATIEPHDSPAAPARRGRRGDPRRGPLRRTRATLEVGGRAAALRVGDRRHRLRARRRRPSTGSTGADVLTTETVWEQRELPARLVVLGGGPIGCELGQAFARLGSQRRARRARRAAAAQGGARRRRADRRAARRATASTCGWARAPPRSAGRRTATAGARARRPARPRDACPSTASSSPPGRRAAHRRHRPRRGRGRARRARRGRRRRRACAPARARIYAAGDVTARLPFTHVAAHHARVAAVNALLGTRRSVDETIPWVTFTDPEVARVGLTEAAGARALGRARDRRPQRLRRARPRRSPRASRAASRCSSPTRAAASSAPPSPRPAAARRSPS